MLGFVDDKRYYVNSIPKNNKEIIHRHGNMSKLMEYIIALRKWSLRDKKICVVYNSVDLRL